MKIKIDKIIRSKRKMLALEVTDDARLIVRAPNKTSLYYIESIVFKKRLWIQKKQHIACDKCRKATSREFVNGESFFYLGNTYRLFIVDDKDVPLLFDQGFRLSINHLPNARQIFIDWYKKEGYNAIKKRLDWYSALYKIKYKVFNITNAFKRWGSCSAKGGLHFSWRLIMAPLNVIDYVVVHELAHIEEQNHSKRFWDKVKIMFPNYHESRQWLRNNGYLLRI